MSIPVPDGDTGSNMLATVKAALEEAEVVGRPTRRSRRRRDQLRRADGRPRQLRRDHEPDLPRHGRRDWPARRRFNGLDLAHCARPKARETAYAAVAKPVEGTILTVIRESAAAAVAAAERDDDIETVLAATVDAAREGPSRGRRRCSPILREAGVVDSGGQGLYRLFQGALLHLAGRAAAGARRETEARGAAARPRRSSPTPTRASATRRCSSLQPNGSGALDLDAIRGPPRDDGRVGAGRRRCAGASRSTSTTSGPTSSSGYGLSSAR